MIYFPLPFYFPFQKNCLLYQYQYLEYINKSVSSRENVLFWSNQQIYMPCMVKVLLVLVAIEHREWQHSACDGLRFLQQLCKMDRGVIWV